jgi:hypothetical protein
MYAGMLCKHEELYFGKDAWSPVIANKLRFDEK